MQGKTVRLLLAEDSELMRRAIRTVLMMEPRIVIVAEAHNMLDTVHMASTLHPDVILLDLNMSGKREFQPSTIRAQLISSTKRLIALSFSFDEEARELAKQYGAGVLVLDKFNLAADLIPAVLAYARGATA